MLLNQRLDMEGIHNRDLESWSATPMEGIRTGEAAVVRMLDLVVSRPVFKLQHSSSAVLDLPRARQPLSLGQILVQLLNSQNYCIIIIGPDIQVNSSLTSSSFFKTQLAPPVLYCPHMCWRNSLSISTHTYIPMHTPGFLLKLLWIYTSIWEKN